MSDHTNEDLRRELAEARRWRDHYREAVAEAARLTRVRRAPNEDLASWLLRALGAEAGPPLTVRERIARLEQGQLHEPPV